MLQKLTLFSHPWPHVICDNFLSNEILAQSLEQIAAQEYVYDIEYRGTGRIEFSLLKSETLWRELYSIHTMSILYRALGVNVRLNKQNMLQIRRMNESTPEFPMHNDYTSQGEQVASFLYLSSGWEEKCGGRLHLFKSESDIGSKASIEPLENRFVAFQTRAFHWHSVEKVYNWSRISVLALWDVI